MNQIFTNGTNPIPRFRRTVTFISMDGTKDVHNEVRGRGTFEKVMENIKTTKANPIIQWIHPVFRQFPCFHKIHHTL